MHTLLFLAASVVMIWDPSPSQDVSLYRFHVGIESMAAGNPPLVDYPVTRDRREFRVTGLELETLYYFTVTAVDKDGLESDYSNEFQYTPTHGRR